MSNGPSSKTPQDTHPKSTYNPNYPHNHCTIFEDASEFHVDCTPGAERMRVAHGPSGTYTEINADGRRVDFVANRHNHYVKGGLAQTVDGNINIKAGGSVRSSVQGDSHSEVQGRTSHFAGGDHITLVSGDQTSAVNGDSTSGVTGAATFKYGGGLKLKFDGAQGSTTTVDAISDVPASLQFGKTVDMLVLGNLTITSQSQIQLKVGSSTVTISSGKIAINSSLVDINS